MLSSSSIIVGLGVGSKIILFNKFAGKLTGYSASEVIGKSWIDIFVPVRDRCEIRKVWNLIVKNKAMIRHHENAIITRRKDEKIIRWTNTVIMDKGRFLMVLSIGEDVTAQKKAEAALLRSEEKYRIIIDNIKDIIFTYAPDGKINFISHNVSEIGYSPDEVIGHNIFEFMHPDDRAIIMADFKKTLSTGKTFFSYPRIRKKDGRYFFAEELSQVVRKEGKIILISGIIRDISERKKAEDELRESEEKYRNQFDAALDAIFIADVKTGKLVDCNRAACELVGRKKSELVGMYQRILHPSSDAEGKFSRTFKQHLNERDGQAIESRVITKKGEIKPVAIKANIFKIKGTQFMQGIFRDITEQKKFESEILKSNAFNATLVENAPFGIMTVNVNGDVDYVNPELISISGSSQSSFKTMNVFRLPSYVKYGISAKIRECFKGKPFFLGSIEYVSHFSQKKTVRNFTGIPMKDANEKIENVVLFVEDLTKQKQEEQELVVAKEAWEKTFNSIPDLISLIDNNHRLLRVNKAMADKLGKSPSDLVGLKCFECVHGLKAPINACPHVKMLRSSRDESAEIYEPRFGRWFDITVSPIRDPAGKITSCIHIARDITERKQAEKSLLRRGAFDNMISMISLKFLGAPFNDFSNVMNSSLKTLGEFLDYSRAYIFLFRDNDNKLADNVYEWCARGVEPQIKNLQGVVVDKELTWFNAQIKKDEIIRVPDVDLLPSDAAREKKHFKSQKIKSLLVLPLFFGSKTIGFFGFDSVNEKKSGSDEDVSILKLFGGVLSDAIIRHRSEQQLLQSEQISREQTEQTKILNNLIVASSQVHDLQSLLRIILDSTLEFMNFSGGGVYLRSAGGNLAEISYSKGLTPDFVRTVKKIDVLKKPFNIVFMKKEAIIADEYAPYHPAVAKKFHIASLASIPILSKNQVVGAINIMSKKKHVFSDDEKRTLNSIGITVGASIVNMQSEEDLKLRSLELEKFNQMTIGRELRMVELKKKIAEMEKKKVQ